MSLLKHFNVPFLKHFEFPNLKHFEFPNLKHFEFPDLKHFKFVTFLNSPILRKLSLKHAFINWNKCVLR